MATKAPVAKPQTPCSASPVSPPSSRRQLQLAAQLCQLEVLRQAEVALQSVDVALLHLKGAAFIDTLYPVGQRPMSDVDVLIGTKQREVAHKALLAHGFVATQPRSGHRHSYREHYNWPYTMVLGGTSVTVEVHVGLAQPGRYRVDDVGLWRRSVSYQGTRVVRTLSPEDSVLYWALHQGKHWLDCGPHDAEDLRRICQRWQPDWDEVLVRASQWRLRTTLFWTLSRLPQGDLVPDRVFEKTSPWLLRKTFLGLAERTYRPLAHTRWRRAQHLLATVASADGAGDAVRFLGHYARRRASDLRGESKWPS